MNERRRIRGCNFTAEEELELVRNIYKYRNIIETKDTSNVSRNEKDAAWFDVFTSFNLKFENRKLNQLKSKYDNLKTLAKKFLTKKNDIVSGYYASKQSPALDIVLSILTTKQQSTVDNLHDYVLENHNETSESLNSVFMVKTENVYDTECTSQTFEPQPSNVSQTEEYHDVNNPPQSFESSTHEKSQNSLRKSKKNPKIQELIRTRTEYLKRKMRFLDKQEEEWERKKRREEEIHGMKMRLYLLDINIKEEELRRLKKSYICN